jgi:hypothetical protein
MARPACRARLKRSPLKPRDGDHYSRIPTRWSIGLPNRRSRARMMLGALRSGTDGRVTELDEHALAVLPWARIPRCTLRATRAEAVAPGGDSRAAWVRSTVQRPSSGEAAPEAAHRVPDHRLPRPLRRRKVASNFLSTIGQRLPTMTNSASITQVVYRPPPLTNCVAHFETLSYCLREELRNWIVVRPTS